MDKKELKKLQETVTIDLAEHFYHVYCNSVGGKAFNGDTLPVWKDFYKDPNKKLQSKAWIEVAKEAMIVLCDYGQKN